MGLIIISFVQTSKLAYKYRLRLWIYVRDSPLIYRVSHSLSGNNAPCVWGGSKSLLDSLVGRSSVIFSVWEADVLLFFCIEGFFWVADTIEPYLCIVKRELAGKLQILSEFKRKESKIVVTDIYIYTNFKQKKYQT